jgi:hypothetical protein
MLVKKIQLAPRGYPIRIFDFEWALSDLSQRVLLLSTDPSSKLELPVTGTKLWLLRV